MFYDDWDRQKIIVDSDQYTESNGKEWCMWETERESQCNYRFLDRTRQVCRDQIIWDLASHINYFYHNIKSDGKVLNIF